MDQSRREFLKLSATVFTATVLPINVLAEPIAYPVARRSIAFYHTHTGESIDVCYFDSSGYCTEALSKINHILRDHRTNEVWPMDLMLLETLNAVKLKVRSKSPFHIISGYRSLRTNVMLRNTTSGVAKTSYHTKGKAIDFRLPGCDTHRVRDVCITMQSGGVGYYRDSDFVHMDTGPVRNW